MATGGFVWLSTAGLLLAAAWLSYRYPWWRKAVNAAHPRILMYHMVNTPDAADPVPHLAVTPAMFERQIRYLRKSGWHFSTVSELFDNPIPPKTVAITFDDGYRDNLTNALPVLLRHRAKATVYLIADRAGPLAEGGRADGTPISALLTDPEVNELLASNAIELGGHTLTHRNLAGLEASSQQLELATGKSTLEQAFGREVRTFAYPFGGLSAGLPNLVGAAGYDSAVTTDQGISADLASERLRLKRIRISGRDSFMTFRIRLRIGRRR